MDRIKEAIKHDRRLVILKLLQESGGTANSRVIQIGLKSWLHPVNLDVIIADIEFLADVDLVKIAVTPKKEYNGATITSKGKEVIEGLRKVQGVASPEVL